MFKGKHIRHRRMHIWVRVILITAIIALFLWPFVEPYTLSVDRHTVTLGDLSPESGMLKIVYAADIHQAGFPWFSWSRTVSLVDKINSLQPDIVLLGGDYASDPARTAEFFENLPAIKSNYGVYAVLGEADRTAGMTDEDIDALRRVMKAKGITLLVNEVTAAVETQRIYIAGVDLEEISTKDPMASVSAKVNTEDLVILLCHNPKAIDLALASSGKSGGNSGRWFDLGLFGHTHGGQLPGNLNLFGIADDIGVNREGWFERNRIEMLVTRGVGTTVMPIRIGSQPQIHVITLQRGK